MGIFVNIVMTRYIAVWIVEVRRRFLRKYSRRLQGSKNPRAEGSQPLRDARTKQGASPNFISAIQ
jgi:hypothetical protein